MPYVDDRDLTFRKTADQIAREEQRRNARRVRLSVDGVISVAWHTTPGRPLGVPRRSAEEYVK